MLPQGGQKACLQSAGGCDVRESGESGWLWRECASSIFHISLFAFPVNACMQGHKEVEVFPSLEMLYREERTWAERTSPSCIFTVGCRDPVACLGSGGKPSWSLSRTDLSSLASGFKKDRMEHTGGRAVAGGQAEACPRPTQSCQTTLQLGVERKA